MCCHNLVQFIDRVVPFHLLRYILFYRSVLVWQYIPYYCIITHTHAHTRTCTHTHTNKKKKHLLIFVVFSTFMTLWYDVPNSMTNIFYLSDYWCTFNCSKHWYIYICNAYVHTYIYSETYTLCSLKEESEQTVCGESLEKKNSETTLAVATLPNKFKTVDSYISVLISKLMFTYRVTIQAYYMIMILYQDSR